MPTVEIKLTTNGNGVKRPLTRISIEGMAMRIRALVNLPSIALALVASACFNSSTDPASNNGGTGGVGTSSGGATANGGSSSTAKGGATGTTSTAKGGTTGTTTGATGQTGQTGQTGSGGAPGTGGAGARGGAPATGGAGARGGTPASGGTPGTGGAGARGGTQANGGTPASGGTPAGVGGGSPQSSALVTSGPGAYWKTTDTWTEVTSGTAVVTVDDATANQTWDGFGGAFNEMGWNYLTTKALQDEALQLLFGDSGCRFAWGRIPMGSSDYAMDRYTDDEVSGGDTSMSQFSVTRDKQKLIPFIKAAQAVKSDIRFWASPWTPPTWMKNTPYLAGNPTNAFDGGTMKNDAATLTAHAQYFVKFVQAYGTEGIKIEYVAPQNEPNYAQNYPSCLWDAANFTNFIGKYLGPALETANSTAQVMLGTMSNSTASADVAVANAVLADSTAKGYCKVAGVQWGMSDAAQINNIKGKISVPIWISEHKCGNYPSGSASTTQAPNDQAYGVESWGYIRDAIKNGVTAYNAWNMVLDKAGKGIDNTRAWAQNALLVVDSGKITQTPAYYVFRHLSQFVVPGAKRVNASGGDAVAFKNPDGSIVAAMYNSGAANSNYVVAVGGKKLQFAMPGTGWATIVYK